MTAATVTNRHDGPYCTNRAAQARAHTGGVWGAMATVTTVRDGAVADGSFRAKIGKVRSVGAVTLLSTVCFDCPKSRSQTI